MASKDDFVRYTPLQPNSRNRENVVVLLPSYYHWPPLHRRLWRCFSSYSAAIFTFLLVCGLIYMIYPSKPQIRVVRIELNHIRVHTRPKLLLDLSFSVTAKIENRDFFSLSYETLDISVGYRGSQLGFVSSKGAKIKARHSSYVIAALDLDGFEIIHDVFYLIGDLARGVIPFDTVTQVRGKLGLFFFKIPLEARVSCDVYLNTNNQTIVNQDCDPEEARLSSSVVAFSGFVQALYGYCLSNKMMRQSDVLL